MACSVRRWRHYNVFFSDFESVAELVGTQDPGAKVVVLGILLRDRTKAAYDGMERVHGKKIWERIVEQLETEFESSADRELAMQQFPSTRLGIDEDPLVLTGKLTKLLRRALPTLDESQEQSLAARFTKGAPDVTAQQLRLVNSAQLMDISGLVKVTRQPMVRQ
ncbi:unnamed protein product [Heterobilharzia americana]|nr:unnamed protein product [Heterobilharzia americana]CAH8626133.1 unnamed protein product [Heterobilharzia americana]